MIKILAITGLISWTLIFGLYLAYQFICLNDVLTSELIKTLE